MVPPTHRPISPLLLVLGLFACAAPVQVEPSDKSIESDPLKVSLEDSPGYRGGGLASFDFCMAAPRPRAQRTVVEEARGYAACDHGGCFVPAAGVRDVHGPTAKIGDATGSFNWPLTVHEPGFYDLDVWVPATGQELSRNATYELWNGGIHSRWFVDQNENPGSWTRVGEMYLDPSRTVEVSVRSGEGRPVLADAVRLSRVKDHPQLVNAAWLAWFSANEYAHFAHIGPALDALGFGKPGDGRWWRDLGYELEALEAAEEAGQIPQQITIETLQNEEPWKSNHNLAVWYIDNYFDVDENPLPRPDSLAEAFVQWVIGEARSHNQIQFFSGGDFKLFGIEFESGTTQAMWAQHRDLPIVVISFRGTEPPSSLSATVSEWQDVLLDLSFFRQDVNERVWGPGWGYVHEGFYRGFNAVADDLLMAKIRALEGTGTQIYITGHSLGGALATMMTGRILQEMSEGADYDLRAMYTYGQPRVGGTRFAGRFDLLAEEHGVSVQRFRNTNDLVTRVPLLLGWEHVGRHNYLTRNGELLLDPEDWSGSLSSSIVDHSMEDGYYPKLRRLMNRGGRLTACGESAESSSW